MKPEQAVRARMEEYRALATEHEERAKEAADAQERSKHETLAWECKLITLKLMWVLDDIA